MTSQMMNATSATRKDTGHMTAPTRNNTLEDADLANPSTLATSLLKTTQDAAKQHVEAPQIALHHPNLERAKSSSSTERSAAGVPSVIDGRHLMEPMGTKPKKNFKHPARLMRHV